MGDTGAAARRPTYILTRIWPGPGAGVANSVIRVEIWPGLSYTTALCVFGISMIRRFDLARSLRGRVAVIVVAMVAGAISEILYKILICYIYRLDKGTVILDILTIPQYMLGDGSIYSRGYMTIAIVPSATVFHRL